MAVDFSARLCTALDSESANVSRSDRFDRALNHRLLNPTLCVAIIEKLLDVLVTGLDRDLVKVLEQCLDRSVVRAALISAPPLLRRLCRSACESRQLTLSRLAFEQFPDVCLLDTLRYLLEAVLTTAPPGAGFVGLITRLCTCLDRSGRVEHAVASTVCTDPSVEYRNSVLYNSVRVALLHPSLRQPLFRLFISMWMERGCGETAAVDVKSGGTSVLSPARALIQAVYLTDSAQTKSGSGDLVAVGGLFCLLTECVTSQTTDVSGELIGWVMENLLNLSSSLTPLPMLQFWSDWLGLAPVASFKPPATSSTVLLSSIIGPGNSHCFHQLHETVDLSVRLWMFRSMLEALSGQAFPLTSSWRNVNLLQWLRACCSRLLEITSTTETPTLPGAWYDCMAQLIRITHHAVHLSTQLPLVITTALADSGRLQAAAQLVIHVLSVYSSLRQLPRLVAQLLIACRAADRRHLLFNDNHSCRLAQLLAHIPLQQVLSMLHTVVFHLESDVLTHASLTTDDDDGTDGIVAIGSPVRTGSDRTEPAGVVYLVLQFTSLLLQHSPILDQNRVPSTIQKQLPDHIAAVARLLRFIARAVCKTAPDRLRADDRFAWLPLFITALVSWKRCQSALHFYSDHYRSQEAAASDSGRWAPLTARLLPKLTARACARADCQSQLWDLIVEFQRDSGDGDDDFTGCVLPSTLPISPHLSSLHNRVSFDTLLQWVLAASSEQLEATVKLNPDSCRLQLAVVCAVTRQLSYMPIKRSRHDDDVITDQEKTTSVTLIYSQLLTQLDSLVVAMAEYSADASREMLQKFLSQLSEFMVCVCSGSDGPAVLRCKGSDAALMLHSLLAVVGHFSLEYLCTERATVLLAVLLLCWSRVSVDSALFKALFSAVRQPWPLLTLQLERLVPFIWRHCDTPDVYMALVTCFPARLTMHLSPLCDHVRTVLKRSDSQNDAEAFVSIVLPLERHLVETWLTKRGKADARASLKRQLKRLTGRVARCVAADVSGGGSAVLWPRSVQLQLCSLIVQLPRVWSKHLDDSTLAAVAGFAWRAIKRGGIPHTDQSADGELRDVSAAWQFIVAVCRASSDWLSDTWSPSQLAKRVWRNVALASATPADVSFQCSSQQLHAVLLALPPDDLSAALARLLRHTRRLSVTSSSAVCWDRYLTAWLAVSTCPNLSDRSSDPVQRAATNSALTWLCHTVARHGEWSEESCIWLCNAVDTISSLMQQRCVALDESACTATMLVCRPDLSAVGASLACRVLLAVTGVGFHAASTHARVFVTRAPLLAQLVTFVALNVCRIGRQLAADDDVAELVAVAERLARVVREMVGLGVAAQPLAPIIIADVLQAVCGDQMPEAIQSAIDACLVQLVGACRAEALTRLRGLLPAPCQLHLHTLVDTYRRFYKFTGRV